MNSAGASFSGVSFFNNPTVTDANNGLSLNGTTVVLGNNATGVAGAAQLINNREIWGNGFSVIMRDSAVETTRLNAGSITVTDANGASRMQGNSLSATTNAVAGSLDLDDGTSSLSVIMDGAGNPDIEINGDPYIQFDQTTVAVKVGITPLSYNGATLQVEGTITGNVLIDATKTPTYNLDVVQDSGKMYTNEAGAVNFQLPSGVVGTQYLFAVQQAVNLIVTADAAETINNAGAVSSAGGTISNATAGSFLHIVYISATQWMVTGITGVWPVT